MRWHELKFALLGELKFALLGELKLAPLGELKFALLIPLSERYLSFFPLRRILAFRVTLVPAHIGEPFPEETAGPPVFVLEGGKNRLVTIGLRLFVDIPVFDTTFEFPVAPAATVHAEVAEFREQDGFALLPAECFQAIADRLPGLFLAVHIGCGFLQEREVATQADIIQFGPKRHLVPVVPVGGIGQFTFVYRLDFQD